MKAVGVGWALRKAGAMASSTTEITQEGDGIRVNTICPTFIVTPMSEPMLKDEDFHELVVSSIALGRVGQVEEIMGAVVYLASNASSLVTGSALMVDGGWTAA